MKIKGSCWSGYYKNYKLCPFLRRPLYHAGFTGKFGTEASHTCIYHSKAVRFIIKCELAGKHKLQKDKWIEIQRHK